MVDLWGSVSDPGYTADTLTTVFSSTKSLTAIALASLVDQVSALIHQQLNIFVKLIKYLTKVRYLQIIFTSLCPQGLLSYGEKISRYWPEFAEHGKEEDTVADLMRHEAGLASLDTPVRVEDTWTENIKKNAIGSILEKEQCRYPEGQKREYHAITRGWVANEIFRRVDPAGRTIGEYLSEEVAGPLQARAGN